MHRREFTVAVLTVATLQRAQAAGVLTHGDAAAGVRAALERGANAAVALLGRSDGFSGNALVRIGLPGHLQDAAKLLRTLGQGKKVDDLVTGMNRAAEIAVPKAQPLLVNAVRDMSVEDAVKLVRGSSTSVTEFFASKTRTPLNGLFLPDVTRATDKLELAQRYNAVAGKGVGLGLVKQQDANIQKYVTRRALDGLFLMIGEEEKKIRANPVQTGSDLLKRVFSR